MDCTDYRELISAHLDGEAAESEQALMYTHLAGCDSCRRFEADGHALNRGVRLAASPNVPDQTASILRAIGTPKRSLASDLLRALVAALGLARVAQALVLFVTASGSGGSHARIELAAAELAIGVGLILVAVRPALGAGLVGVLAVLAAATAVGGAGDVISGRVALNGELLHLIDALAALVVWRLSVHRPRPRRRVAVIA